VAEADEKPVKERLTARISREKSRSSLFKAIPPSGAKFRLPPFSRALRYLQRHQLGGNLRVNLASARDPLATQAHRLSSHAMLDAVLMAGYRRRSPRRL